MKIVFAGATTLGLKCLEAVRELPGIDIAGIITAKENFTISYRPDGVSNCLYADFQSCENQHNIPVYVMQKRMTEPQLLEAVDAWMPDLFLIIGWYHMVPRVLRNLAPAVGLHASLLPNYCGGAPLVWAVINGEEKTGMSLFRLGDGVDDGDIIGQEEIVIRPDDTIATLLPKAEQAGIRLLHRYLPKIMDGSVVYTAQDASQRCIMPQRSPEDGVINWNQPSKNVHNFVRAQTRPYPGAFTTFKDKKITVWEARCLERIPDDYRDRTWQAGEVLDIYAQESLNGILIGCAPGGPPLLLTRLHADNTDFSGAGLAAAARITPGTRFGSA